MNPGTHYSEKNLNFKSLSSDYFNTDYYIMSIFCSLCFHFIFIFMFNLLLSFTEQYCTIFNHLIYFLSIFSLLLFLTSQLLFYSYSHLHSTSSFIEKKSFYLILQPCQYIKFIYLILQY